ncbi:MAG: sigma 54-interacting transcriptional regulator, partial [Holophagales bacterium]|nr:sigma 54-interacting transcriptional regulator [Holophagales bacterium]
RGAFTGADRDRQGIFESARGGTVFLDEIGDLPSGAQAKLLRVLEEGEIRRVGESLPRKVDVRIVAATHRDLEQMVEGGEFRQDLLYRLKVARVLLPPLGRRGDDVLLLADFFLQRTRRQLGTESELSSAARQALLAHSWPGNVRELRNVLEVAAALAAGDPIRPEHLDLPESALEAGLEMVAHPREDSAPEASGSPGPASEGRIGNYHQLVLDFRRDLVRRALRGSGGNRAAAARTLDMTRQNLSYLVRQLFEDDPLAET